MLVIVQGPPAAGKTTVAAELRRRMKLPLVSRDALSERLLDSLGVRDERWTAQIGDAAYELMFALVEELAAGPGGFIIESTFNPVGAPRRMAAALVGTEHEVVEVFLHAPVRVLVERYRERWKSGGRHRGHLEESRGERLRAHLESCRYQPMRLGEHVLEVDTQRSVAAVVEEVASFVMARARR